MKKYAVGADLGGTTVKMGIFTVDGMLEKKWEIPTRTEDGGRYIISDIASACELALAEAGIDKEEVAGIGIGVPGAVNLDGSVDQCVNIGWGSCHVKKELQELIHLPVSVANDANVAALGEMWQGGGKGYRDLVLVTLGTGVGGGIIVDGNLLEGAKGYAGEIGHMVINTHETVSCNCGKKGCLEQYCSATGIVNEAKKAIISGKASGVLEGRTDITAKDVFDAAKEGDAFALEQVDRFADRLARGLSYITAVTDPDAYVIGGGVSKAGQIIIDYVKEHYQKYTYGKQKETDFALATLGNDAGIYGCAKLILLAYCE